MRRRPAVLLLSLLMLVVPAAVLPPGEAQADEPAPTVNLSETPAQPTAKAKLDGMQFYVPAVTADGTPTTVPYFDGEEMAMRGETKPLVAVYEDAVGENGGSDVFGAYSRDDGATWQKVNLSVAAERSSIALTDGAVYGAVTKPAVTVKGNRVLAAWTSTYCAGGAPRYAGDPGSDWWGVGGTQGSRDYDVDYPDLGLGERAFECLWTARGVVNQTPGESFGEISWFQPERLTSGKRWAMQIMANSASSAGFGVVWSEDPEGIRPGQALGPGSGFTGANAHEGTDVWYSWIGWADFAKVDAGYVPDGSEPELVEQRPRAAVQMSMPVRISDNQAVPAADRTGDRLYGEKIPAVCADTVTAPDVDGTPVEFCVTADERLLDGDTFGTRPNLFVQPYLKADGVTYGAWAVVAYEESKGINRSSNEHEGDGDGDPPCGTSGKNVVYHSFDVATPERVAGGTVVNPQMTDEDGEPLFVREEDGTLAEDWKGDPIPAYENARRVRLVGQPKAQAGPSGTVLVVMFRQGEENQAGPADILMRRVVVPAGQTGNPYRVENLVPGWANVSSVTPTASWTDSASGLTKAVRWTQSATNLSDKTSSFPEDDAVGLRGFMKGDFLAIGYTWTPSLDAARAAKDVYNFYLRRSFDGGQTFTTNPGGAGGRSCTSFTDPPTGRRLTPECTDLGPGEFEPARNLSMVSGLDTTIIEPRLVGQPSSVVSPYPEDVQNTAMVWAVWGTGANVPEPDTTADPDDEDEGKSPLDVIVNVSNDTGDTFPDASFLAGGPTAQGEAQVRMTPDGSVLFAAWNDDGPGPLDAFFRVVRADDLPGDAAPPPPYVPPPADGGGGGVGGGGAPTVVRRTEVRGISVVRGASGVLTNPFVDVLASNVHHDAILVLHKWAIANGVTADHYRPGGTVTRAQMASFIARTLGHTSVALPIDPPDAFEDDDGNVHEKSINRLAAVGIVLGRGQRVFAPDEPVERGEAVTLVVRLYERLAQLEMSAVGDHFGDDGGSTHHANINKAVEAGLTNGTAATTFDPSGLVRRDQMASLLARLLDILVAEGYATM